MLLRRLRCYLLLSSHVFQATCKPTQTILASLSEWPGSYAAIGDSYAAGAGAGSPIINSCGRFTDAYPVQVAHSTALDIPDGRVRFLACGGSDSRSVLIHQVPFVAGSDIVTLTVGGNEVRFFAVLNACVYQWLSFSSCQDEVAKARASIESQELVVNIDAVISEVKNQLRRGALLLVTGYARFFNEETDFCDHVTFSRTRPLDYLTKEKRRTLNQLISLLNDVIRAATELQGARYVDMDTLFEGHRFCEKDVHEPDIERQDTWFFNLPAAQFVDQGTDDRAVNDGLAKSHLQRTFNLCQETAHATLEACVSELGHEGFRSTWTGISNGRESSGFPSLETARTFHPTVFGHRRIAEAIVEEVRQHKKGKKR